MAPRTRKFRKRLRRIPKDCFFCKQKTQPDYKETDTLKHFLGEWGRIIGKKETGVCHKHQRILAISIRRARYIALLPYVVRPS
ncbi:30S ribosomal protein S18 [Candidatus Gottesmanbacteria bacterium]|nr:30S ribosomal protein S18 [Candidatus Gottesmanbacteria bacterium]